jgi:uncharacterized protein YheU (UPF0270 family)
LSEPTDGESALVVVPPAQLAPLTLQALIEAFVLREGTDYGEYDVPLATKVAQVLRQLQRGEAQIVFDPLTETVDIRVVPGR